jgi:O-antigen/teichoic acid export membrane protein
VSLGKFDFLYFKHLIKASLPLLLSGISIVVFMKISQIMVGTFLSKQSLGVYSVAATISELIFFVPHCVTSAVYPKIVKAKKENTGYEKLIAKTGSFNIFLCVLFALFCTFLAPFLIEKLYGEAYREAKGVVQIYGWVGVFMALGNSHSCYLVFENIQKYSLYSIVSSLIINIFLGYFFIKHFGINGAAVSFLISQIFGNYLCYGFFKDKRSFFLRTKSLLFNYGSI